MLQKFTWILVLLASALTLNAQVVIWGDQPGQGDFDGGLSGWTIETPNPATDSSWLWSSTGDASNGLFAGANTVIQSNTVGNGCMMYDYDFQTTGGTAFETQEPMISHLISPTIDISGATKSMSVVFTQMMRWFQSADNFFYSNVSFSVDGGTTWSDFQDCNGGVPNGSTLTRFGTTYNTKTINIPKELTTGQTELNIRFTYAGNFYYWAVDDVFVIERENFDVSANPFYAIAPNLNVPSSQVGNIGFLIDVENLGDQPAPNANATIDITDPSGTSIYTTVNPYGDLDVDSLYENTPFPEFFPAQELDPGTYTVTYSVSTDSMDTNPDNDSQSFEFTVTDSIFAKETGATHFFELGAAAYDPGDVHTVYFGAHYLVPNGDGYFADKASFSIAGTDAGGINLSGQILTVKLYEWSDVNEDLNANDDERTLVALGIYTITGTEGAGGTPGVQTVDLVSAITGQAPALKDNTEYILMMEFDSPTEEADMGLGITLANDYTGNFVLGDQVDYIPFFHSFIKTGSTETAFDYRGLGYRVAPVARFHITTSDPTSVSEIPGIVGVNLSPNPVSDLLTVEVNAEENIGAANIVLFDANGMAFQYNKHDFSNSANFSLNVESLAAGQYYLGIRTDEGQHFSTFQVIR